MKRLSTVLPTGIALCLAGGASALAKEVLIGGQCDRTGPTQIVGVVICPAIQDYIDLVNSKGGVGGYQIRYNELDNEYKVPQAVEEYERQKQMGAVSMMICTSRHARRRPRTGPRHSASMACGATSSSAAAR